ncbi:MAG: cytochrome c biosis protein CcmG, thiol:disulfide interchange protein DsbE [Actinomycetota bacterium]|jgi:cytochrome c biogenesis protein CcmG/thiol:disulfide interchange protein DsbE|nr:cytochrome c biosis protein CcmG, thiol:disulfide interchange protein DsbE [Actinomycetota bacterium]
MTRADAHEEVAPTTDDVIDAEPRRHTAAIIAVVVGVTVAVLVYVLATRPSAEAALARSPLLGHPAPDLSGKALDGSTVRLADLHGRYVLVNFFASWCVPCHEEHPELLRFTARHSQLGDAQVVGVIFDDTAGNARAFMAKSGGDWPIVDDPNGQVALDFGVRGPPESFLIDPNGFVISKIVGQVNATGLEALIAKAKRGA